MKWREPASVDIGCWCVVLVCNCDFSAYFLMLLLLYIPRSKHSRFVEYQAHTWFRIHIKFWVLSVDHILYWYLTEFYPACTLTSEMDSFTLILYWELNMTIEISCILWWYFCMLSLYFTHDEVRDTVLHRPCYAVDSLWWPSYWSSPLSSRVNKIIPLDRLYGGRLGICLEMISHSFWWSHAGEQVVWSDSAQRGEAGQLAASVCVQLIIL